MPHARELIRFRAAADGCPAESPNKLAPVDAHLPEEDRPTARDADDSLQDIRSTSQRGRWLLCMSAQRV